METPEKIKSKKKVTYKILLPENFQEILIKWEMKFETGDRQLDTIRNILYMYSVSEF